MKRTQAMSVLLVGILALTGCSAAGTADAGSAAAAASSTSAAQTLSAVDTANMFSSRDVEVGYDEETCTKITLSGDGASSDSDAVQIDGSTVTITDEGTYLLSGTLHDGQIIVNAEDTDKVQLVLNGVNITSSTSAAIYVAQADKVFVTTASGSENTLTNGGEYIAIDENNIDAVIFSKSDLTVNGEGALTIDAKAGHGIVSKDDLALTSGTYTITAASQGLSGKNSVRIAGGDIVVTDGTFTLKSGDDAVHADANVTIQNGKFSIPSCYEGIEGLTVTIDDGIMDITASDDGINAADGSAASSRPGEANDNCAITINGGTVTIVSDGDCLDSNGALTIAGGTLHLTCNGNGNTALDCDGTYTNTGGSITTNDGSEENPNEMGGGSQDTPNNQNGRGGPQGGTPPSNGQTPQKDSETA